MKLFLMTTAFTLSLSAFAKVQTAEFYELDGWIGEYPTGYQTLSEITVETVTSPTNPEKGETCTLKKDIVIHPWAKKTKSTFATLFPVSRYKALEDLDFGDIKVAKGQEILQLSYLSEGFCLLEFNGVEFDEQCLGMSGDKRVSLVDASPFPMTAFFRTICKEGFEAWINANQLESYLKETPPGTAYAEIEDYGSVKEP